MRKSHLKIASLIFLCSVLILGGCVAPSGMETFLEDEKVQEIITKNTGADVDIGFENEGIVPPTVIVLNNFNNGDGRTANNPVILSRSGTGGYTSGITLEVTNANRFDFIIWYFPNTGTTLTSENRGKNLQVNTAATPFNVPDGLYQLSVTGIIGTGQNAKPYNTEIYINVVP